MAPTIFIALQCYQCSTMQKVRQQKKGSNKWTCVVCNQKQSVRKVFAEGYMGKDLRIFVQSFNMSRNNNQSSTTETLGPTSQRISSNQSKRRTDWTEYLDDDDDDPEDNQKQNILEDDNKEGEFEIVTEMPREMFKKPKLDAGQDSKRNTNTKKHAITKDEEPNKCQQTISKGSAHMKENHPTTAKRASKWNDYITQDDDDLLLLQSGRDFADAMGQWSNDDLETITNDDTVEDDIHPDFI